MNIYESIKNNITESDLKESGSQTTSLDYVKELAGYLQDFIDGCEKRNMTELSLPYSHLAGDALAVAGDRGGWITLTSDFSYDDDEIFDEYKPDGWTPEESNEEEIEDSETVKENDADNFGSEQNTDAYESIKSLIKYFNQYIEVVKKDSFHYQGEDPDKLYKVLTKLYEVQDAMDEAWPVDGE